MISYSGSDIETDGRNQKWREEERKKDGGYSRFCCLWGVSVFSGLCERTRKGRGKREIGCCVFLCMLKVHKVLYL